MSEPLLVFGWGNPARGDDGLGPAFVERLRAAAPRGVELLDDYQLQIEHALDLVGRERVLFVDASAAGGAPFRADPVLAAQDTSCSTHALSPAAVLKVYRELHGRDAPPATVLAIRGERFGLGEGLSPAAQRHLDAALEWAQGWIANATTAAGRWPAP